jgi:hypothetical protein
MPMESPSDGLKAVICRRIASYHKILNRLHIPRRNYSETLTFSPTLSICMQLRLMSTLLLLFIVNIYYTFRPIWTSSGVQVVLLR